MLPWLEPVERVEGTSVIWQALAWQGFEHLYIEELGLGEGYIVDSLSVGVFGDRPSRVWYRLEVDADWTFESLHLTATDEVAQFHNGLLDQEGNHLELLRTADGQWDHDRVDAMPDLSPCTDIDIAVTPFTNTLPIRRLNLYVGESAEITVVYITVPELTLAPVPQRYTRLGERTYRYESLDSGFVADITVDEHGLVDDYPGLFRRVWPE